MWGILVPQSAQRMMPAIKAQILAFAKEYGLSYRRKLLKTPTIVWDFSALKTAIDTLYSFYATDPEKPLRICKHCGKAFVTANKRAEFRSVPCRNQFNAHKSRGKR